MLIKHKTQNKKNTKNTKFVLSDNYIYIGKNIFIGNKRCLYQLIMQNNDLLL